MSLFKTFQKDRKIETTPFDLSFQNLLTANFGGLTPLGSYPVLPKDRFKIGSNILTKVEPMPAPAFCRIKQNTYAFFTPNSTVWKHWNDYVTNGTAYADTYGNNANNQKTDNQWRPPQVSVNNIQLISKLANGWAIPVFRLSSDDTVLLYTALSRAGADTPTSGNRVSEYINYIEQSSEYGSDKGNVYLSLLLWKVRQTPRTRHIADFFDDIPYFEFSKKQNKYVLDVGCDFVTAYRLKQYIDYLNSISDNSKKVSAKEDLKKHSLDSTSYFAYSIRIFSDNISDDVKLSHGPFILQKKQLCSSETDNRPINYYVYRKNIYEDLFDETCAVGTENNSTVFRERWTRRCGYFWSIDFAVISTSRSDSSTFYPCQFNGISFNGYPETNPSLNLSSATGLEYSQFVKQDDFLTLHNFKNTYNEIFYDTTLPGFSAPTVGGVAQMHDSYSGVCESKVNPFNFGTGAVSRNTEVDGLNFFGSGNGTRLWNNYHDVEMPLFYDTVTTSTNTLIAYKTIGQLPSKVFFTYESYNIGFDAFSFMLYLCQNSVKLLDYYNIPLEGFTSRSFTFYAGEYLKMLPFYGYSKIWNDYFRNKTVSTAELDYSETNSEACCDLNFANYQEFLYSQGVKFPDWKVALFDKETPTLQGWSIPFDCSPKNSMSNYNFFVGADEIHLSDFNHFHDLRIRNYWTLFSVLTGHQLFNICLNSICTNFDDKYSKTLYGILADKLYLPSYYNGLLHYKYQNFNKDYFSSALLDPAAGANDEQIGDTISSLVTAQAKQGFWNRLANNRSVKQFWNSVFGIDPSHDEYDKPLLLGSAHTDVNIGEVVQLSQTDTTPQGQRSGLGSAHDKHGLCNKQFNEHGYVLILLSHTLELQYMQGLEKDWTPEESFLDLPFIDFVGLGNQSINQRELNFTARPKLYMSTSVRSHDAAGTTYVYPQEFSYNQLSKVANVYPASPQLMTRSYVSNNQSVTLDTSLANGSGYNFNDVFGYIPRYSTWKFKLDQCHGEFRNSLDFWHSFRKFFTQPILCHEFVNWEFMSENDELGRMFFMLDDSTDKFKIDAFINCTAYRPLPYVCVPATSKS